MNGTEPQTPEKRKWKHLALIMMIPFIWFFLAEGRDLSQISYTNFKTLLNHNQIKKIEIRGDKINGEYKKPVKGMTHFQTTLVNPDVARELEGHKVEINQVPESGFFGNFFSLFLPIIFFWVIWSYILNRNLGKGLSGGAGFLSIGKSKAKIYVETKTKVTFKDVAGADEALEELSEVIEFLKNSEKIKQLGGKMPKGVLLVGPPGTGKTLIAKAIAGAAGVPFFSTNGAEFVEMFVGVGAARVRDLFEQAKQSAPCIIFIDELDALGKVRHLSPIGGNDEKEQTLNQLLVEMDGFDTKAGIIILAATNRPEIIDPALLRAGRFDRQVLIDKPDKVGRTEILKIHARNVKLAPDLKLENISALTPGFSGADLANLVNEAALMATRENATVITEAHFTEALERMLTGLQKKNRLLNAFERRVVAHHEMGHALVGRALSRDEVIHKVSIIPRGIGSMGYTIHRPMEDRYLMTKDELENKMATLLAGRAAESLIFHHLSTGAADDLVKATNIAREMVMRYGMTTELGFVTYDESTPSMLNLQEFTPQRAFSDNTSHAIDETVKRLSMNAYYTAYNFLKENRSLLESSAEELMKHETLTEEELAPIFEKIIPPTTFGNIPVEDGHLKELDH